MKNFESLCEIAQQFLVKKGYSSKFTSIVDIGEEYIFVGSFKTEFSGTQYGNTPVAVNKNTGEVRLFPFSIIKNLDLYYDGIDVEIPEKYRMK